jgi:peptide/nickel transport system substrate-binding protein
MTDSAAALATLLSGDAHIALDYMLQYPDGAVLKDQWAANKGGTVLFSPVLYWCAVFQFREDQISPPAVRDVRFRRALVYGMDKQGLNDALFGGTAAVTYGQLSPRAPYYASIEPSITKYVFDPRKAQQLIEEVGLQKGADGFYVGPDRQPVSLEVIGRQNPTWESENAIVVEGYRRIGLNAEGRILAATLANQGETRATFKALQLTGSSGFERGMGRMASSAISRPETRWQGSNYGGWSNSEYDRLWDLYNATLDASAGIKLLADMEKLQSEEVPQIPMYYQPIVTPFVTGLVGPKLRDAGGADTLTRIWEWHWAS